MFILVLSYLCVLQQIFHFFDIFDIFPNEARTKEPDIIKKVNLR